MNDLFNKQLRRDFIRKLAVVPAISYLPFALRRDIPEELEKTAVDYSWTSGIKNEHPRLFLNKSIFPGVKARALNVEREVFEEMKTRVDVLIGRKIEFKEPLAQDGTQNSDHEYGTRAAEAAFLYLVLNDKKYLSLSKYLLITMRDYYNLRVDNKLNIHWYAWSTINSLTAYDWIYNDLTEKERSEIGGPLLGAINKMVSLKEREPFFRENTGGITTGFYGPPSLSWYAGIVFHKTGIDDALAEKLLLKGYDDFTALLKYRSNISGDDGGASTAVLGYCMGAYPWAEFNFFHTFNSLTGTDIAKEWPYVPELLRYVFWNWLPDEHEYGYGDTRHFTNKLPLGDMHMHLSQMIHFYGAAYPDKISLAKWMQLKVQRRNQEIFPFMRFLLTNDFGEIKAKGPSESTPKARLFKNMGQIFMRSGSGADDTYALFTAGGILVQHRHYDNNNFVIYKKGFLALDTGTRPQPGLHLTHYFCRTVAHNCILINMPGETMPRYWGVVGTPAKTETLVPVPNDGGQSRIPGSEVIAFEENANFVYIASDATDSYHKDKADLVIRQFVFLPPDHFVIFDRVISSKAEYKKTWLLHTATEPAISNKEFYADHGEGRLFCRTLLPQNGRLTKIGGPGKQFWSGDKNWPLPTLSPDDWNYKNRNSIPDDTKELLGQWRVEVSPEKEATSDLFLHLIQVGERSLQSMAVSETVQSGDMAGVRFTYGQKQYEVLFNTKDKVGGKILIKQSGDKTTEEYFTQKVNPQKGLF